MRDIEQERKERHAAMKVVLKERGTEDSAMSMEQPLKLAATKDAPTMPRKEECVGSMGQRVKPADMKDALTQSRNEESV